MSEEHGVQQATVEVPPVEESQPKTEEKATEKEFKEAGFAPEEIEMAKEQGMITEEEKDEQKEKGVQKEQKEKPKESKEKEEVKIDETLSNKDIKTKLDELTNEDGTIKDKKAHGLLSEVRRERRRRREAEDVARRREAENKYLQENLERIKADQEKVEEELNSLKEKDTEFLSEDEKERRKELRDKEKDLKNKEKEITEKAVTEKQKEEKAHRALKFLHESEQEYIQAHPGLDFNKTGDLANDVLGAIRDNKIDEFVGDEVKSAYAEKLARKFVENSVKLSNGEIIDEDLPELVHKLAKLHPEYTDSSNKELADKKGKDIKDGKIQPDKIDRMMRNADRRNTAAISGTGGGRILVKEDDLTWEDAVRLPKVEFEKLSQPTIDRLLKESCGAG